MFTSRTGTDLSTFVTTFKMGADVRTRFLESKVCNDKDDNDNRQGLAYLTLKITRDPTLIRTLVMFTFPHTLGITRRTENRAWSPTPKRKDPE